MHVPADHTWVSSDAYILGFIVSHQIDSLASCEKVPRRRINITMK